MVIYILAVIVLLYLWINGYSNNTRYNKSNYIYKDLVFFVCVLILLLILNAFSFSEGYKEGYEEGHKLFEALKENLSK